MDHEFCSGVCFVIVNQVFSFGYSVSIYPFKVNARNIRKRCKICSKLTIKIPEQRLLSGVVTS